MTTTKHTKYCVFLHAMVFATLRTMSQRKRIRMIDTLGEFLFFKLVAAFGGQVLFIPKSPVPSNPLATALTPDEFATVCRAMGGGQITVPLMCKDHRAQRNVRIVADRQAGLSYNLLARKYCLTARRVQAIVKAAQALPDAPNGALRG